MDTREEPDMEEVSEVPQVEPEVGDPEGGKLPLGFEQRNLPCATRNRG